MASNSIKLLTGNSHPMLAKLVAERYATCLSLLAGGPRDYMRREDERHWSRLRSQFAHSNGSLEKQGYRESFEEGREMK